MPSNISPAGNNYVEPTIREIPGSDGWYKEVTQPLDNNNTGQFFINPSNHILWSHVFSKNGGTAGGSEFDPNTGKLTSLMTNKPDGTTVANTYDKEGNLSKSVTTTPSADGLGVAEEDVYQPHGDSTYTSYHGSLPSQTVTIGANGRLKETQDFDARTGLPTKTMIDGENGNYTVNTFDAEGKQVSSQSYDYYDQPIKDGQAGAGTPAGGGTGQSDGAGQSGDAGGAGTSPANVEEAGGSNPGEKTEQIEEPSSAPSGDEG